MAFNTGVRRAFVGSWKFMPEGISRSYCFIFNIPQAILFQPVCPVLSQIASLTKTPFGQALIWFGDVSLEHLPFALDFPSSS